MTIHSTRRASSTLSSVPDMLGTPISLDSYAKERLMSEKRVDDRAKITHKIKRLLENDRLAFRDARKKAEKALTSAVLEPDVLEQKLVDAAFDRLTQRRRAGIDVSTDYPVFKDYIPPAIHGRDAKGLADKHERQRLIALQLDMLCSIRDRTNSHEESDDEEENPYLKKEDGEDMPVVRDSVRRSTKCDTGPTKRDMAAQKDWSMMKGTRPALPTLRRRSTRTITPRHSSDIEHDDDEYTSATEAETEVGSESEPDSESENEEGEDCPRVPLVAVTRDLPLLKDQPTSTKSTMIPKHRFATNTESTFKAVILGQIISEHDSDVEWVWVEKKGMTPKKRARTTEGQELAHDHKKAKVEADT